MIKRTRRHLARAFACCALLISACASAIAHAEIVVVGNPRIDASSLDSRIVSDFYLGRAVQLSTGQRVEVVDLPAGHPAREEFYGRVLGRDPSQIRAYWAKRIFTGKGTPPEVRPDEAAVLRWVAGAPGRIGYVRAEALERANGTVKVLLRQ